MLWVDSEKKFVALVFARKKIGGKNITVEMVKASQLSNGIILKTNGYVI